MKFIIKQGKNNSSGLQTTINKYFKNSNRIKQNTTPLQMFSPFINETHSHPAININRCKSEIGRSTPHTTHTNESRTRESRRHCDVIVLRIIFKPQQDSQIAHTQQGLRMVWGFLINKMAQHRHITRAQCTIINVPFELSTTAKYAYVSYRIDSPCFRLLMYIKRFQKVHLYYESERVRTVTQRVAIIGCLRFYISTLL